MVSPLYFVSFPKQTGFFLAAAEEKGADGGKGNWTVGWVWCSDQSWMSLALGRKRMLKLFIQ